MVFRRLTLLLAGLGLAASLALAAPRPADASTKITVTATGTILDGEDSTGTFGGSAGAAFDLVGLTATLVQVFTLTPGTVIDDATPGVILAFFEEVTATVTVNGVSVTFTSAIGSGYYGLFTNEGLDASTAIFNETANVYANTVVLDEALAVSSLLQEFAYTGFPGIWQFGASAFDTDFTQALWFFVADPMSVTVTVERVPVPAPAALALFLVGLAGLAAARRQA
jgi:hypothetical protein